jgi:hypothetical protein
MYTKKDRRWLCSAYVCLIVLMTFPCVARDVEIPAEVLRDKIRGGLLGQILGNLNGLPHEMTYITAPGNVQNYVPALPEGARTDDDTDFEWVYIVAMQKENTVLLSPQRIAQLWKQRINRRIWCSNQYARQLMDLGLEPPLTGAVALNPWAEFNISGQFLCETFGLLAPGMPQTAARIGLNYTRVAIDEQTAALRLRLRETIGLDIRQAAHSQSQARAAYLAICLDLADSLRQNDPLAWQRAVTVLRDQYPNIAQALFYHSEVPLADSLRQKALAAGLPKPVKKTRLWQ